MSGDLAALPLAPEFAFATPSFDRSSDPKRYQRYGNHDGDDDDDYGNRRHALFVPSGTNPYTAGAAASGPGA
jgi:hypothetical protein